jgi:hypothetical protein
MSKEVVMRGSWLLAVGLLLLVPMCSWASAGEELTADEVLTKALEALGGKERLAKTGTIEASGSLELLGMTGSYEYWAQAPNKFKEIIDLEVIYLERAVAGEEGWEKRDDDVKPLAGADLESLKRRALFQPLLVFQKSAFPPKLGGRETIDDREVLVVEVQTPEYGVETIYFDAESLLPVREVRTISSADGEYARTTSYGDYRLVDGVLLPFSIVTERPGRTQTLKIDSYRVGSPQTADLYRNPLQVAIDTPFEVGLASIPRRVFKENDGVWAEGPYESWVVHVVVDEKHKRLVEPISASAELYAGDALVKTLSYSAAALEAVQDVSFKGISVQPEVFDLRHYFSEPASLDLDRLVYRLRVETPRGEEQEKTLEIPLERYEQKTELVAPLEGKFVIAGGHAFNEDHRHERSQFYADDIMGLGPDYQLVRGDGASNEDYYTWGREILAPAAGTVVFARNDVPDNSRPGVIETERFLSLPDPLHAIGGNLVVLDHGNEEFSLLGHMIQGSVRVSTGDRVERGQTLGLIGNSGNSDAPHLHYHLMAGDTLFQSDGLPARFENVVMEVFTDSEADAVQMPTPKRGLFLVAR